MEHPSPAKRLFGTPVSFVVTAAFALAGSWLLAALGYWFFASATGITRGQAACELNDGACWPFIYEKYRFILFGTFPYDEHWRPACASLLLIVLCVVTCLQFIGRLPSPRVGVSAAIWIGGFVAVWVLMAGGVFGLSHVDKVRWNGLPILLILAVGSIALAFPLGLMLALARFQDSSRTLKNMAAVYIEVTRAIPMITILFVGVFVLPLMLPKGVSLDPMPAALVAMIFFHAAYFAEDWRSGLSVINEGQGEASRALGLRYGQTLRLVLIPQAFKNALPALMNTIIGAYKDTSLVVVLAIHDLVSTARMSFSDPEWRGYALEAYVFIGIWFLVSCGFLSWIGRKLRGDR